MIRFHEITKQDRITNKIMNGLTSMILTARKGMSYDDMIKNCLTGEIIMGVIDFGISEGAFMPSYTLKNWIKDTRNFFDSLPPHNILVAIYKELQKYPQGSIRGYK
jgi:hypothetical protein